MKTLHAYLSRQVLLSLLMTVAVFTFVLLLGNVLKEIIALLVTRQISAGLVLKAIGLLIPYVMAYVLPFAMLTAVILVFGRFSADQELTAVRASGVSLASVIPPVLLLSLFLCACCALFNLWIAPQCRGSYKNLIFELGSHTFSSLILEDRFIYDIPGIILYVRKKDGDLLQDVRFYTLEENEIKARTVAEQATVVYDEERQTIEFKFTNAVTEWRHDRELPPDPEFVGPVLPVDRTEWGQSQLNTYESGPIDLKTFARTDRKPKLSEMSFAALRKEKRILEARQISAGPVLVQMHRQLSFSFACFAFTLVGIPLAIQAHRRETSIGVAIALILVLIYYGLLIVGEALEAKEHLHPHLLMWVPNLLFQALGAALLYRANKG
jgi:lipopolysaccharide export system permease protein